MVNFISRLSPHNCTECEEFEDIKFFSEMYNEPRKPIEDVILIDCKIRGKKFCNNSLWLCESFKMDDSKRSLVIRDTTYHSNNYRIFTRARPNNPEIETIIYDYVCKVCEIDSGGYNFTVAVAPGLTRTSEYQKRPYSGH
jgi:hypothetical protein